MERVEYLPKERDTVKTFFLGIFPQEFRRLGIGSPNTLVSLWKAGGGLALTEKRTKNSGVMIVAFAAVAAWQIYDMTTATETLSRALAILQYVPGCFSGLAGAVLNFIRSQ